MALCLGELVGFLRADDSGWRAGLTSAELRLRGERRLDVLERGRGAFGVPDQCRASMALRIKVRASAPWTARSASRAKARR